MNNKKLIVMMIGKLCFAILSLIVVVAIYSFIVLPIQTVKNNNVYKFELKEGFFGEFCHLDKCIPLEYRENVITTCSGCGLDHIKLLMGLGANSPVKYLALGNGTVPTASSTTLNNEQTDCGLARATGNYYDLGVGYWEINTTFTFNCSVSRVVNTTANFNASSTGTLYAGGTISTITFTTNGDQLKLRHNFTIVEGS